MVTLITVLIIIASIILILVVLVQKSQGGGLASNFSSSNAVMGVRKTTDFIEKATWGLVGFIIVMSIIAVMIRPKQAVGIKSELPVPMNNVPAEPDFSNDAPFSAGDTKLPAEPQQQTAE